LSFWHARLNPEVFPAMSINFRGAATRMDQIVHWDE
jgi:hypothetical protein